MASIPLVHSLSDPRNLLTLMTLVSVSVLGCYALSGTSQEQQTVLFALLLTVLPFLPASNLLFPVGFVMAERILYVPSMGFSILISVGLHKLSRTPLRGVVRVVVACVLVLYALKTVERNRDWQSDLTLFTSAIHTNPSNGKLYNNLGFVHEQLKNYSRAEELYRTAVERQADDTGSYINLGRVLKVQGRYREAEEVRLVYSWGTSKAYHCPGLPDCSGHVSQEQVIQDSTRTHQCVL